MVLNYESNKTEYILGFINIDMFNENDTIFAFDEEREFLTFLYSF